MTTYPSGATFEIQPDALRDLYQQLPPGALTLLLIDGGAEGWPCAVAGLTAAASELGTVTVTDLNTPTKLVALREAAGEQIHPTTPPADNAILRSRHVDALLVARDLGHLLMPEPPHENETATATPEHPQPRPSSRLALQLIDNVDAITSTNRACFPGAAGNTPEWCPGHVTALGVASLLDQYAATAPAAPTIVVGRKSQMFEPPVCEQHAVYDNNLSVAIQGAALATLITTLDEARGFAVTRAFRVSKGEEWTSLPRHRIATLRRDTFDLDAYFATGDDYYLSMHQ